MLKQKNMVLRLIMCGFVILLFGGCSKNNNLDVMHALINNTIEIVNPDGALDGGKACIFVCEEGGILFKNHLFEDYRNNWSGITGVTTKGKTIKHKICMVPECEDIQIFEIGPVSGKHGYVACKYIFKDGKPSDYWIYELDENFCKNREIHARLAMNELFECMMGDSKGYIHVTFWRESECHVYMIISPEGEMVFESELGKGPGEIKLCAFGGGRVAVCDTTYENDKINRNFSEVDLKTGMLNKIAVLEDKTVKEKINEGLFAVTLVSDSEITWCDLTGIWLYNIENKETRLVYDWSKHEIDIHFIYDLSVTNDDLLGLIYADQHELRYLLLSEAE